MVEIIDRRIDEAAVLDSIKSDRAGACVLFVGTTRGITDGRTTRRLDYEAYRDMAIPELERLIQAARENWPILNCHIVHRTGEVQVGETSVAVAVSSPHREPAFEAAAWLMDRLKQEVPIWKREVYDDGSQEWIHPQPQSPSIKRS